jgi:hypothetical protein
MSGTSLLRAFAVLFGLLAISNLLKPLEIGGSTGFVLLGNRLSGTANMIVAPLFGVYLAIYAAGIWRQRAYALPMGIVYAAYVLVNLVMWTLTSPYAADSSLAFGIAYTSIAVGVSGGAALLLLRSRDQLS